MYSNENRIVARGQSPPRTPPPSYDEATKTEADEDGPTAPEDTSTTTLGSTITLDSSESDRANNNSLDTSVKSATSAANNSVEIVGQMLYGARQGSLAGPQTYRRINQRMAAEAIMSYQERLREGHYSDVEDMEPPEVQGVPEHPDISTRSVAQSPLSRQEQLPSNTGSDHSSMPSLTISELSNISDDGIDITGYEEAGWTEEDTIILHEDETERTELEADLSPESRNIVDEIDNQIKSYYTTPRGKGKDSDIDLTPYIYTHSRKGPGQGLKGSQGVERTDASTSKAGLNCMAHGMINDSILLFMKPIFELYNMICCGLTEYMSNAEDVSLNPGCWDLSKLNQPEETPSQVDHFDLLELTTPVPSVTSSTSPAPSQSNTASSNQYSSTLPRSKSPAPKMTERLYEQDTIFSFYYHYSYYATPSLRPRSITQPGPPIQAIPSVNSRTQLVHSSFTSNVYFVY